MNPLQIAAQLKRKPLDLVRAIAAQNIPAQKDGLRAGLYDVDAVTEALRLEDEKREAAKAKVEA